MTLKIIALILATFFGSIGFADQLAQAEASQLAKVGPDAPKVKSALELSNEGCQKKLIEEITKIARKQGVVGDFGVQFYENDPYKKAGLGAKKEQLFRYVTPPFVVDEGYISNSKADALVKFTPGSCDIVKLSVNTGSYTQ